MGHRGKVLITDDGRFDLATYQWDDHRFSDIIAKENPIINPEQAMAISRFVQEEIAKMETLTITMPVIEKMIEAKLLEYGLKKPSPIRLDKSVFVKNGLVLSDNARVVLERRYLRKNTNGKVIEKQTRCFAVWPVLLPGRKKNMVMKPVSKRWKTFFTK